jgi:serine/threonine protein kinase
VSKKDLIISPRRKTVSVSQWYVSLSFLDSGRFGDFTPAAVKCIKANYFQLYENEIKQLPELIHPYVVRCFATKSVEDLFYIAMERGFCNLREFMERNSGNTDISIKLLHDSCLGLQYLHDRGIVHKDINPKNILVIKENDRFVGKLSGFGLSKDLKLFKDDDRSILFETFDCMPPEALKALDENKEVIYCRETDIYSMGVTMFNILSRGEHPGGVTPKRLLNVRKGKLDFKLWKVTDPPVIQFQSCIESMICLEMKNRASISFVLSHPWTWQPEKNLDFILATHQYLHSGTSDAISDREKLKQKLSNDLKITEVNPAEGWKGNLCQIIASYLENTSTSSQAKKKYDVMDYSKLIEFIMNEYEHKRDHAVFGGEDNTYIRYFTERFPGLIPTIYMCLKHREYLPRFRFFYSDTYLETQDANFAKESDKIIVAKDASGTRSKTVEPFSSINPPNVFQSNEVTDARNTYNNILAYVFILRFAGCERFLR